MDAIPKSVLFTTGYAIAYLLLIYSGIYASPAWGGENLFSLWLVVGSLVPGLLINVCYRRELHPLSFLISGAIFMLFQIPALVAARWICSLTGITAFLLFALIYTLSLFSLAVVLRICIRNMQLRLAGAAAR